MNSKNITYSNEQISRIVNLINSLSVSGINNAAIIVDIIKIIDNPTPVVEEEKIKSEDVEVV